MLHIWVCKTIAIFFKITFILADFPFVNSTYTLPKPLVYVTVIITIINGAVVPLNMFTIFVILSSARCNAKVQFRFLCCLSVSDM